MYTFNERLLNNAAKALLSADFDGIVQHFAETVAVFQPDGSYRVACHEDLREALTEHRSGAVDLGVTDIRAEIAAIGMPRAQKQRLFVDWVYSIDGAEDEERAQAVYYIADRGFGPKIEMVECRSSAFRYQGMQDAGVNLYDMPQRAIGGA